MLSIGGEWEEMRQNGDRLFLSCFFSSLLPFFVFHCCTTNVYDLNIFKVFKNCRIDPGQLAWGTLLQRAVGTQHLLGPHPWQQANIRTSQSLRHMPPNFHLDRSMEPVPNMKNKTLVRTCIYQYGPPPFHPPKVNLNPVFSVLLLSFLCSFITSISISQNYIFFLPFNLYKKEYCVECDIWDYTFITENHIAKFHPYCCT